MTYRLVASLLAGLAPLLCPLEAGAQSFDPRVSVRLGTVEIGDLYTFYPEVEVENRLHTFEEAKIRLDGSLFAGYWNDGFDADKRYCEEDNFCYRSFGAGARMRVIPERLLLPLSVFGELSYNVVDEKGLVRTGYIDERFSYVGAGAGLRADVPIIRGWSLVAQFQVHQPFMEHRLGQYHALTVGVNLPL